jgi:TIGR00252 family protein
MNNVEKGKFGENIAALYLRLHFYKILERNYRVKTGEIDIIAKKDNYIVFVEVKYRKNISKGYPREAVTAFKQNQIKRTAMNYMMSHNIEDNDIRFDVIEIIGKKVEHIKNAFW